MNKGESNQFATWKSHSI